MIAEVAIVCLTVLALASMRFDLLREQYGHERASLVAARAELAVAAEETRKGQLAIEAAKDALAAIVADTDARLRSLEHREKERARGLRA